VGKTTIGGLLADRLECSFLDLDREIEKHFGTSIERLQARFLTDHSYRREAAVALKRILTGERDCVISLPPSGLRDAYVRVIQKVDCVTVAIEDTPENILGRITFYDTDSRLIEKNLTDEEKRLYRKEIRNDITFFRKSYQRADLHVDIAGLDAAESAKAIAAALTTHRRATDRAR
jgi:shikimate kinase